MTNKKRKKRTTATLSLKFLDKLRICIEKIYEYLIHRLQVNFVRCSFIFPAVVTIIPMQRVKQNEQMKSFLNQYQISARDSSKSFWN